jgi:acetyl esterase/lipase
MDGFAVSQRPGAQVSAVVDARTGLIPTTACGLYVPPGDGALPVVLYLHGGYIACALPFVEGIARDPAARLGAIVVTATYRKAPEHRFPAAPDDACAALQWLRAHPAEHGGDPAWLAVAGFCR